MKLKNASKNDAPRSPAGRFHIRRLEERLAPKKGGKGTNNCPDITLGCTGFCPY